MPILVCGINYKTANLAIRERVFFALDKLGMYLQELLADQLVNEAVLLSTCNRSELYCETNNKDAVLSWFNTWHGEQIKDLVYTYDDGDAVMHLMKVAAGLDSMVLGEAEILGQVKTAFAESCAVHAVGKVFQRLFQHVFAVAKEIRATTKIGACPVSIASATLTLASNTIDIQSSKLVLLGAGKMSELILRHLSAKFAKDGDDVCIVNRSLNPAAAMAEVYGVSSASLQHLPQVLSGADLLVTASASINPIITMPILEEVLSLRQSAQPLLVFDLAVPRNVVAEVATMPGVYLYTLDDLSPTIAMGQKHREHAAHQAMALIEIAAQKFMQNYAVAWQADHAISDYRHHVEALCELELNKALKQLGKIQDSNDRTAAEEILRGFAYTLTQKLLHAPSVNLRQVAGEGRVDLLTLAKKLLAVPGIDSRLS